MRGFAAIPSDVDEENRTRTPPMVEMSEGPGFAAAPRDVVLM